MEEKFEFNQPKIQPATDAQWLEYYRGKSARDHKEIMSLKEKVAGLEASVLKWRGCFDKVHNLVSPEGDMTPYEVIEAVKKLT